MKPANLDDEMRGIFDRADELTGELIREYEVCAQMGEVSERAKNLFHEVLIKIRSALDFAMRRIFDKHTTHQGKEKDKIGRQAGFPICDNKNEFCKKLKKLGLSHLEENNPDLYKKLLQAQPFKTGKREPRFLRELSNLGKHVELAAQHCNLQDAEKITRPNGTIAVFSKGSGFVDRDGKPVDPGPDCEIQNIICANFSVSNKVSMPDILCRVLCQDTRRYVAGLLLLI